MPVEICDRNADIWEALFVVTDAAGGAWPARARLAAVTLVTDVTLAAPSWGVRLLGDTRTIFDAGDKESYFTDDLLTGLSEMDESPWGDLRGKPLDARGLARRLSKYEVKPKTIRVGASTAKGYSRSDFCDAWSRYLPESPRVRSDSAVTSVTTSQVPTMTPALVAVSLPSRLGTAESSTPRRTTSTALEGEIA
jgi:hypothetical protein